jgi:hypothetical protein
MACTDNWLNTEYGTVLLIAVYMYADILKRGSQATDDSSDTTVRPRVSNSWYRGPALGLSKIGRAPPVSHVRCQLYMLLAGTVLLNILVYTLSAACSYYGTLWLQVNGRAVNSATFFRPTVSCVTLKRGHVSSNRSSTIISHVTVLRSAIK